MIHQLNARYGNVNATDSITRVEAVWPRAQGGVAPA